MPGEKMLGERTPEGKDLGWKGGQDALAEEGWTRWEDVGEEHSRQKE